VSCRESSGFCTSDRCLKPQFIQTVQDKYSAVSQIRRSTFSENLDARLKYTLKATILRGISAAASIQECSKPRFSKALNWELSLKHAQQFLRRSIYGKDY